MTTTGDTVTLADCREFRLTKRALGADSEPFEIEPGEPRILSLVEGEIMLKGDEESRFSYGDNVLLPACGRFTVESPTRSAFLITDRFI